MNLNSPTNIVGSQTVNTVFTPEDNGVYLVTLTVTDLAHGNAVYVDHKQLKVANVAPHTVAILGAPTSPIEGSSLTLTSSVIDPGLSEALVYAWSVTKDNQPYTVSNAANSSLTWTPSDNGVYVVRLSVTDKDGAMASASPLTLTVVNAAPVTSITGQPTSPVEGQLIELQGVVNDADYQDLLRRSSFSYSWLVTRNGSPYSVSNNTNQSFSFLPVDDGTYLVSFTATDSDAAVGPTTTASIAVANGKPVATIDGGSTAVTEGTTVFLTSSATDPGVNDTLTSTPGASPRTVCSIARAHRQTSALRPMTMVPTW